MQEPARKYLAFLSYASSDQAAAIRLQRTLEFFRVPKALRSNHNLPPRIGKIFRDRSDLAASTSLPGALRDALSQSQHLVVLCSPAAAKPESWVNREISLFRELRPDGQIFAVIVSGSAAEAFPPALLARPDGGDLDSAEQPLAADLSEQGDGPVNGPLKLIAALLGVDFDDLRRRHEEAERKRKRRIALVISAYAMTVSVAVVLVTVQAIRLARSRAESIAEAARTANEKGQPDTAMLLALTALPRRPWPFIEPSARAEAQLWRAYHGNRLRAVFAPHTTTIWAAAFDPDRGLAITGACSGELVVSNIQNGRRLTSLPGHHDCIRAVVLAEDRRLLATAGDDGDIRSWDWPQGRAKWVVHETGRKFSALALSDDSRWLVAGDSTGASHVFNAQTGERVATGPRQPGRILGAVFSADGERVLTSSYGNSVVEWNRSSGEILRALPFQGVTPGSVGREPGTNFWVTTYALANYVDFWNPETGKKERSISVGYNVASVAFSRHSRWMLVGGWDRTASLFDAVNGQSIAEFDHPEWVDAVGFADRDMALVTAGHDGRVRVWQNPVPFQTVTFFRHACRGPSTMARMPRQRSFLFGGFDGAALLLDASGSIARIVVPPGKCPASLRENYGSLVRAISVSPDSRWAAVGAENGSVVVHSLANMPAKTLVADGPAIQSLMFSADSRLLAAVNVAGDFQVWAVHTWLKTTLVSGIDAKNVYSFAFAPNGRWLAMAWRDGPAFAVYDLTSGHRDRHLTYHRRVIMQFRWSSDSRWLASASADETTAILDLQTSESQPTILRGNRARMMAVDWSPGNNVVFTADSSRGIYAWHRASGEMLARWNAGMPTADIAYDAEGSRILASTMTGEVIAIPFPLPPENERKFVCDHLPTGREGFSASEMLERRYLTAKDQWPCR